MPFRLKVKGRAAITVYMSGLYVAEAYNDLVVCPIIDEIIVPHLARFVHLDFTRGLGGKILEAFLRYTPSQIASLTCLRIMVTQQENLAIPGPLGWYDTREKWFSITTNPHLRRLCIEFPNQEYITTLQPSIIWTHLTHISIFNSLPFTCVLEILHKAHNVVELRLDIEADKHDATSNISTPISLPHLTNLDIGPSLTQNYALLRALSLSNLRHLSLRRPLAGRVPIEDSPLQLSNDDPLIRHYAKLLSLGLLWDGIASTKFIDILKYTTSLTHLILATANSNYHDIFQTLSLTSPGSDELFLSPVLKKVEIHISGRAVTIPRPSPRLRYVPHTTGFGQLFSPSAYLDLISTRPGLNLVLASDNASFVAQITDGDGSPVDSANLLTGLDECGLEQEMWPTLMWKEASVRDVRGDWEQWWSIQSDDMDGVDIHTKAKLVAVGSDVLVM